MGITKLFGRIFGSPEATKEIITSVSAGLDVLVYTQEEKAQAAATERAQGRAIVVQWMEATSGQNLARRFISMAITMGWLAQYGAANLFAVIAVFINNPEKFLAASAIMAGYANQMNGAVMLILGFYFAAPHLGTIVDKAMDRFGTAPPTTPKQQ